MSETESAPERDHVGKPDATSANATTAPGARTALNAAANIDAATGFAGLRVLSLESRRAVELAKLITAYGGVPVSAPAMREIPLESNSEAVNFARALVRGEFDLLIFLTGVGARVLLEIAEAAGLRESYIAALQRVKIAARGPKPVAALREIGVAPALSVPEPNTWREILETLDSAQESLGPRGFRGLRIAVQEYGVSNVELLAGLTERGAKVVPVPVYRWALPEDQGPLRAAIAAVIAGEIDAVLFTTGVQAAHLFQVAAEMHVESELSAGLRRAVVASIGPTTTEELSRHGISPDVTPSHPKMGFLVRETAERAAELLRAKK